MSMALIEREVQERFAIQWTRTPAAFENEVREPAAGEPWVRLTVEEDGVEQVSLGDAPLYRRTGRVRMAIHVPAGSGSRLVRDLADDAEAVFRGFVSASGVRFGSPFATPAGFDGQWSRTDVSVPFAFDFAG